MNFNELEKYDGELSPKQSEFLQIHNRIMDCGRNIVNGIIELSKNLKYMRDEKLYIEAEFETFEDYAEKVCGLKRSQAYSYIQILERLGEEFVQSTGQIGITKLTLLSSLPEEERKVVVNSVNIEDSTVIELKNKIAELNDKSKKNIVEHEKEVDALNASISELQSEIERLKQESLNISSQASEVEIVQSTGQNEFEKMDKLEKELKDLKSLLKEEKQKAKLSKESFEYLKKEYETLQKQVVINNSTELLEFKLKFNDFQKYICDLNSLLKRLPADKQDGCKNAIKKVLEGLC